MKKLCCTMISLLLLGSASIPIFAMKRDDSERVEPELATLRNGSSTKTTYFDITETYKGIPFEVRMAWSLTYFVNTGKVNACSIPSVSVMIPDNYAHSDMWTFVLKDVSTKAHKSGEYACLFTAVYKPVVEVGANGWLEYVKPTESFIVKVTADGEISIQ